MRALAGRQLYQQEDRVISKAILSPVGIIKTEDKATVYCTIEGAALEHLGMQQLLSHGC